MRSALWVLVFAVHLVSDAFAGRGGGRGGMMPGGGSAPPPAWNVFEVTDPGEKSLEYVVEEKKKKNKGAEFTGEDGRTWRLVCTVPTEEEAAERKEKLERENLCWGAFRAVREDGAERFEVKRIPKSHPRKFKDKYDTVWHLGKKCPTEEKAESALAKLREKQERIDAPEAQEQDVSHDKE